MLLADDIEQQHANHYADTKARHRVYDLKGTAHQGRNGEKCQGSIDSLRLQALDPTRLHKRMQGRMYNVTVADNGLDHIGKAATIHALRIDIEQGVRPVTGKSQHDHQSRRQRYKHHPIARGHKARALHRLGIDKPNETRDGKERKRNRVGNPVGSNTQRAVRTIRKRPDHIE